MKMKKKTNGTRCIKHFLLAIPTFAMLMAGAPLCAQENSDTKAVQQKADEETVYIVVEKMPKFPGGMAALMKYLSDNIKYPKAAQKSKTQGRVIVQFVVEKDGTTSNYEVKRSVSPELDAEALRVLKSTPKWSPGMQKGEPVRTKFTIPITFRLP